MSERTLDRLSGLDGLFGNDEDATTQASMLPVSQIILPKSQPRRYFDQNKLESLANSIKEVGLLEPIVVRCIRENTYELVAGERRLKACQIAKLENVAVNLIECDNTTASRIRLVENLQREDLNVYEETIGILELLAMLLEIDQETVVQHMYQMHHAYNGETGHNVMSNKESLTIQKVFTQLGKITWQSFVSNRLPILNLKDDIKAALAEGKLEYTKALAISKIKDKEKRTEVLRQAIEESLSLSKIKEIVKEILQQSPKDEKNVSVKKQYQEKTSYIFKLLKKSKVWDDDKKVKQLMKSIGQIEKLLTETDLTSEIENDFNG
ncbi:ParB/RepB/Spo0J family partition protein [Nostoc sp. UHCC 0252]|uniref:ParB/RepB/Spo0J family partition protein n=1 Tax=Nostoc sp. UHCC 0252 TaxID=3110241 RepID=UPI002B1FB0CC|nr:ParB/RepB/Spo0J family partition protein [Nostoc sp. UHCC 0252]MEA5606264.1 ParB/RepB/Spo0J family partition protein [Nostoc sp. UHCC 0252]